MIFIFPIAELYFEPLCKFNAAISLQWTLNLGTQFIPKDWL